ncbi:hypothetical protein Phum_PHUM534150 [Pediculus humanus corporis]|uniref:Uncharacterized protein n=1 Tax=Pediculus humanus subsp. corporis TaxID=121224 RepID=E0VZH5_PEDHC|nr:uncharacterized protein Phum_PHUM534150 [Pediculus humanus corporis]EEB18781.1 hypothetical protein Phum_PHUM534150 [Pediculus humanus corporis]
MRKGFVGSTFVGSVSPDGGYHMLQVKREPSEASPVSYMYGGNVSPMYPGASPGPPSPNSTPSPVPYTYSNVNLLRHNAGGGLIELKPNENNPFKSDLGYSSPGGGGGGGGGGGPLKPHGSENSTLPYSDIFPSRNPPNASSKSASANNNNGNPDVGNMGKIENNSNRSHVAGNAGNTMLDMDSQQYSLELNLGNLDSAELTRMAMMTDANLSENLSSNLTLDDKVSKSAMECDQNNMTDSFTRVANNVIQELVSLGDMNQGTQQ